MKNLLTLTIVAYLPFLMIGQNNPHNLKDVLLVVNGNRDILKNWEVSQIREYSGVKVQRVAGENGDFNRTNVLFYPAKEKYSPAQIGLFFDRQEKALADASLLTITVSDPETNDTYLVRSFDSEEPYCYQGDVWYNYLTINLPFTYTSSLKVEVEDAGLNKDYSFMVYDIPVDQYTEPVEVNAAQTRR